MWLTPLLFLFDSWQITSGMVISTFVSAPIMYVSAWLLTIPSMDPNPLAAALQNVSFDISIVSLISLVGAARWDTKACVVRAARVRQQQTESQWGLAFLIISSCRRMRKELKILIKQWVCWKAALQRKMSDWIRAFSAELERFFVRFVFFFLITGCEGIKVPAYTPETSYIKPSEVLGCHSNEGCVQTSAPEMSWHICLMKS